MHFFRATTHIPSLIRILNQLSYKLQPYIIAQHIETYVDFVTYTPNSLTIVDSFNSCMACEYERNSISKVPAYFM